MSDLSAILKAGLDTTRFPPLAQSPTEADIARSATSVDQLSTQGGLPDISQLLPNGANRATQIAAPASYDIPALKAAQESAAIVAGISRLPTPYTRLQAAQGHQVDTSSPYAAYLQKKAEGDQQVVQLQHAQDQDRVKLLNGFVMQRADAVKQGADENAAARAQKEQADANRDANTERARIGAKARVDSSQARLTASAQRFSESLANRQANDADKRAKQDAVVHDLSSHLDEVENWLQAAPSGTGSGLVDPLYNKIRDWAGDKAEFDTHMQPIKSSIGQLATIKGDRQLSGLMTKLGAAMVPEYGGTRESALQMVRDGKESIAAYENTRGAEETRHGNAAPSGKGKHNSVYDAPPAPPGPELQSASDEEIEAALQKVKGKR